MQQEPANNPDTMRRMGDTESSIAYWQTQPILWNGEQTHRAAPNWVSQRDEE